jgi:hypothetical protein
MRNFLLVLLVGASACAARTQSPTLPVQYTCGDRAFVREGARLSTGAGSEATPLGWHTDGGDHFVPALASTDREAVEIVVPSDPRSDATVRVYAASEGMVGRHLLRSETCTAHGGYSDALTRYATGATIDQLAVELTRGDQAAARDLVHHAMLSAQRRYFRDR